jgi:hypothetical protein
VEKQVWVGVRAIREGWRLLEQSRNLTAELKALRS